MNWLTPTHDFKEGDMVVLQMGSGGVPRTGIIIVDKLRAQFWGWEGEPLAFYSPEQHYFAWLDNVREYLTNAPK